MAMAAHSQQAPPPPPLSLAGGPPQQTPSVLQILQMGQERNHAADALAHHPRIESLIKLGKESEATWLQIGQTAEALGDYDRAIASYESALRHNAYSVIALSQIAAICRSKEEFRKAAEYFGRVVGIAPDSGDVWGALGHCYLMIDDLKKAYSSYQQALYYMPNPQEPKLWYGIGILYDRYGSLEHAEEAFSSVIRMDPDFEKANEIFFRLGIIYKQQRKSAQSLECFRYILSNPPRPLTEIDIWFQIGHVYEQQKDFLAAKESYERVLAENPAHAKVLQQLGGLYHRSRAPFYNPELSVQILTKSLESDANDPFSWYLLGRAYMTTSNYGKAYEAYQQAVYRDGKNPAFWCSIGVLYYNINQFHDALDAYSRAIRIHPYLAEVWFNLGALYESCNDQMTDAIDAYQRTLQLDPSNTIVSNRLREIREHQTNGTTLSNPPQPKDISPSSLSWNYATNAGGAPATLAQAGLGPDMSPAMSRSGGNGSAGSPVNGHQFEGPPSSNGTGIRPGSTDPSYRGPPMHADNRRRTSGAPPMINDQSPRPSTHRLSAGSQSHLPQMKSMQDHHRASGASPTFSTSAAAGGDHKQHRGSPVSPRTRAEQPSHPSGMHHVHGYPPHGYGPREGDSAAGGPPAPPGPPPTEMEWRNANGAGRTSAQGHRLHHGSPPGSSHGPPLPSGPPPQPPVPFGAAGHPGMYAGERRYGDNGAPLQQHQQQAPPHGYPTPYGYAPYVHHHHPAHHPQPPPPPSAAARYEASSSREEHSPAMTAASATASRRNSDEKKSPKSAAAEKEGKDVKSKEKESRPSTANGTAKSPAKGRKKAADKAADDDGTAPTGRKASGSVAGSKRKNENAAGGSATKKERRTSAAATKKEKEKAEKAEKESKKGAAKLTAAAAAAAAAEAESSRASTPSSHAPATTLPSRDVDEDYDEGVDALMGLAASASAHGHQSAPPPPPPPPAPAPTAAPAPTPAPAEPTESAPTPRKRALESPELGVEQGGDEKRAKSDVAAEAPTSKGDAAAPVATEKEDGEVEEEEGEVKEEAGVAPSAGAPDSAATVVKAAA